MQARSWAFAGTGLAVIGAGVLVLLTGATDAAGPISTLFFTLGAMAVAAGLIGLVFAPSVDRIVWVLEQRPPEPGDLSGVADSATARFLAEHPGSTAPEIAAGLDVGVARVEDDLRALDRRRALAHEAGGRFRLTPEAEDARG